MKNGYRNILLLFFCLTISVIGYEIVNLNKQANLLAKQNHGFDKSSPTGKLVENSENKFIEAQKSAVTRRSKNLYLDFEEQITFIIISLFIILQNLQDFLIKLSNYRITLLKNDSGEFKRNEINLACLIYFLFALTYIWFSDLHLSVRDIVSYSIPLFLGYFIIMPLVCIGVLNVLKNIGVKLILACYIAYFLKIIPEIIIIEPVDTNKMEQISGAKFPESIQKLLRAHNLEEKIYVEKNPGPNLNAALVGYGKEMRIEITGDFKNFSQKKMYSVFLHELGHAYDHSLFKKALTYFSLIAIECIILCLTYAYIAPKFSHDKLQSTVVFILLVIIYKVILRQWLFMFYKIVSQSSEIYSDKFAMKHGYRKPLGHALYEIALESNDYIQPSILYNMLRSGHPSIYQRIEYLLSNNN